jgi:hypothetical protein
MGVDYNVELAVGFRLDNDQLQKKFMRKEPVIKRTEPRFDQRTGKRMAPEVVLEGGATYFEFKGERLDDLEQLVDAICRRVQAEQWMGGSMFGDEPFEFEYVVGPRIERIKNDREDGHITVSGEVEFNTLIGSRRALRRIKRSLAKLGIRTGEAVVVPLLFIC